MTRDETLGGYLEVHERPPAFTGPDGAAYSVGLYVDDAPGEDGRFGAALVFVRWAPEGDHPTGHLETPYLAAADTPEIAASQLRAMTLHEVKAQLDRAVAADRTASDR